MFNELRGLAQPLMQNGGSLYDVIELYSTKSTRQLKKVFKDLRDKQDALQQQAAQQKQQEIEQQGKIAQAQIAQAQQMNDAKIANDNYQNELDRINKKELALIAAEAKSGPLTDIDESGTPDVLEMSKLVNDQNKAVKDYEIKMAQINAQNQQATQKLEVEREKNQIARENMANDLAVAKENAKGRNSSKNKK
jgi:hypothetical protein